MEQESILVVDGLCKKYRRFQIKDISFSLQPGYILGLIGRNGAGKTTLMKLLQNIVRPDSGTVKIAGFDAKTQEIQCKNAVGIIMEQPFFDGMTIAQNGKMFGMFYEQYDEKKFYHYLERFKLDPQQAVSKLSKGTTTKFQMAFALSHNAKLLILDEPTGGLDPIFRREFLSLLQEVVSEEQVSVVISTHITSDLDKVADYIAMIDQGELMFYYTKEELFDHYSLVKGSREVLQKIPQSYFVGTRKYREGFVGLTEKKQQCMSYCLDTDQVLFEQASIEDIMYFINKGRCDTI